MLIIFYSRQIFGTVLRYRCTITGVLWTTLSPDPELRNRVNRTVRVRSFPLTEFGLTLLCPSTSIVTRLSKSVGPHENKVNE